MIELIKLLAIGFAFGAAVAAGAYCTTRLLRRCGRRKETPTFMVEGDVSQETIDRLQRALMAANARLIP